MFKDMFSRTVRMKRQRRVNSRITKLRRSLNKSPPKPKTAHARYRVSPNLHKKEANRNSDIRKSESRSFSKHKKFGPIDQLRLETLSKPRYLSERAKPKISPLASETPLFQIKDPDFNQKIRMHFNLPYRTSRLQNEQFRDSIKNVSKANIYGLNIAKIPLLYNQMSKYK